MNKVVFWVLVLVVLVVVGCGGEPTAGSSSPDEDTAPSGGGENKTVDPCGLLTDAQVEAALGAPASEVVPGDLPGAVTCNYAAEAQSGPQPRLQIMAYTDETLVEWEDRGTGSAQEYWEGFHGGLVAGKTGGSDTSYTSDLSGIEVAVEEIPALGDGALLYRVEGTPAQLWLFQDYAVFSLMLSGGDEGQESERLRTVAEQIAAALP